MHPTWNPDAYSHHARFVSDLGMPLLDRLAPRPGERILDLGCGDGALTVKLHECGCDVVGVDSSPEMVAAARSRGVDAHVMDAQALRFENAFDAIFSNAALHWMKRPDDVIAGVWRALRPGGRFAGEFGGEGNVATVVAALRASLAARGISADAVDPWYFPSVEEYRARLEARSFQVRELILVPRPTPLPTDILGWLKTFAQDFIDLVPAAERVGFLQEVAERCRPKLQDEHGTWVLDYVRLRFLAIKPKPGGGNA
ncbi:class I SAM-dependent methyltransferase [Limnochorda pilosa]|uniref:Trans-aconitate methyltransferase n=1 Tax=Limnochorda pilosa TaxID=1555112 RepID=A0A0K2SLL5_LIMPI|nr:class I SAM-dependent methyltransferase [Limnochorda pilosa]BAS27902.1 trans-aconitate methyltransferase [Limnochorda pilosa]